MPASFPETADPPRLKTHPEEISKNLGGNKRILLLHFKTSIQVMANWFSISL